MRRLHELLSGSRQFQQAVILYVFLQIAGYQGLADNRIPYLRVHVFTRTEFFQLVVLMIHYVVGSTPAHEIYHIVRTEVFLDFLNGIQHDDQSILGLLLRLRMQTVVTIAAIILQVFFTEIMEQHLATADRRLGIGGRLGKELPTDILLGHGLAFHKLLQLLQVLIAVESYTLSFAAVTTSSTCLLIIAFQTLGDIIVDDKTDVGFVDTHAKSNGSHDDVDVFLQEIVLRLTAGGRVETGMIGSRLDVVGTKHGGQFLHLLARKTVDDAALAGILPDELHDLHIGGIVAAGLLSDFIIEVWTVEGTLEFLGIHDAQTLLDVRTHLIGCRSRQGNQRSLAYLIHLVTDFAVFRTEVMPPFRNTVSLIDGIETDLYRFQEVHILVLGKRFRSNIKQLRLARKDITLHKVYGGLVERRVQIVGNTFLLAHAIDDIHLILHQGDKRGDDDGRALHNQGGQLVA